MPAMDACVLTPCGRTSGLWALPSAVRFWFVAKSADPGDFALGVRPPNRLGDTSKSHSGEQVREILGPFLDGDDFADLEAISKVTHDDAMLGAPISLDDDLAAVGEIARLAVVLQPNGAEKSCVQTLQRSEDLTKNGS